MAETKKIPLRKCVGCQQMKSKKELLRVLRDSEGTVCIDLTGRKNGRGAYLCRSIDCFAKAKRSRAIERSLQTQIAQEVYEQLQKEIESIEHEQESTVHGRTGKESRQSGQRRVFRGERSQVRQSQTGDHCRRRF